jgi:hypothetical protein
LNNPRSVRGDDELTNLFRAALEERRGSTSFAPGKRTAKNQQSGRQSRKQYHAAQALRSVGGFARTMDAIHASATIEDKDGNIVPRPMCVVVDNRRGFNPDGTPFRNVGGNTDGQNYIGGRGL